MSARRSRASRSYRAAPLHPLPGHKLHAFAEAAQRYRPSARDIEARVFDSIVEFALDRAVRQLLASFVFHDLDAIAQTGAKSVPQGAPL